MMYLRKIIVACMFLLCGFLQAENLSVKSFSVTQGEVAKMRVTLQSEDVSQYVAFQFDLTLPQGIVLTDDGQTFFTNYFSDANEIVEWKSLSGNRFRFSCYSASNQRMKGKGGDILQLTVKVGENMVPGIYQGRLSNIKFALLDSQGKTSTVEMSNTTFSLTVLAPSTPSIVTVKSYTRQYGDANPMFEYTISGGDLDGQPDISCSATPTSPVGIYDILISQGSVSKTDVTYVKGTLTITKAPLTVKADDKMMKEGDPLPELTFSYSGFKNSETDDVLLSKPSVSTTANSNSPQGAYPIYVSGGAAENYDFIYCNGILSILEPDIYRGHTLVINFQNGTQEKVVLSGKPNVLFKMNDIIVKSPDFAKTYHRSDIFEFKFIDAVNNNEHVIFTAENVTTTYGNIPTTFNYNAVGASYNGYPSATCAATRFSPPGQYPIILSQGSVDNDNTTFKPGVLTITKGILIVTADNKTIKKGENIPELTFSYDGFVNGESEDVLIQKPTIKTTATKDSEPGVYPIIIEGGKAANYIIVPIAGLLTIEEPDVVSIYTLIMHLHDGRKERFVLSEEPLFNFSRDNLIIKTPTMGATFPRADIKDFTFELAANDINGSPRENEIVLKQMSNGDIAISGHEDGDVVKLYDMSGRLLFTRLGKSGEEFKIPLTIRGSGVYLININNKQTIKIQKK